MNFESTVLPNNSLNNSPQKVEGLTPLTTEGSVYRGLDIYLTWILHSSEETLLSSTLNYGAFGKIQRSGKKAELYPEKGKSKALNPVKNFDMTAFMVRIHKYGQIKQTTLVYCHSLMARLVEEGLVNATTVLKVFISLIYISMKFLNDDDYFQLEDYSLVVGLPAICILEIESFVLDQLLGWDVFVGIKEFKQSEDCLVSLGCQSQCMEEN